MIYEFQTESGSVVEIDMAASSAPPIGETMEWNGATLRRIASRIQAKVPVFQSFKSMQLGHGWPYANKWERNPDGSKGAPIFTSEREARGCMAAGERNGEGTTWKTT